MPTATARGFTGAGNGGAVLEGAEIPRLDAAAQAAWAEVNFHWREGRLTSDLPSVRRGHVPALGRIRVERRARWGRLHVPSCGGRCWQLGEFVAIPAQTAGTSES